MRKILFVAALCSLLLCAPVLAGDVVTGNDAVNDAQQVDVVSDVPGTAGALDASVDLVADVGDATPEDAVTSKLNNDSSVSEVIAATSQFVTAIKAGEVIPILSALLFLLLLVFRLKWVKDLCPKSYRRWLPVVSMALGVCVMLLAGLRDNSLLSAMDGVISGGLAVGLYEATVVAIGGKRVKAEVSE